MTSAGPRAIVVVGKGFDSGPNGDEILLLPHVLAEFTQAPVVAVGGPSIAKEVALGTPTAAIFGSSRCGRAGLRPAGVQHTRLLHRDHR